MIFNFLVLVNVIYDRAHHLVKHFGLVIGYKGYCKKTPFFGPLFCNDAIQPVIKVIDHDDAVKHLLRNCK